MVGEVGIDEVGMDGVGMREVGMDGVGMRGWDGWAMGEVICGTLG